MRRKQRTSTVPETREVTLEDFNIIETLGNGSYGVVLKVVKKDTNEIYALKCLNKQQLMKEKQLKYAISESKILR